ncbi:MAG TPA: hypothetical protein VFR23_24800 [Jiangellaceae bacterium]|nr:hypothetical protein [Jiangellaceae bacterium]
MPDGSGDDRRARAEFLKWAVADFRRFCGLLAIQPKGGGGRIRFLLSPIQRQYDAQRTARDIILKPRQVYITTLEAARDLWFFITRPGARVVVVCQSQTDGAPFKDIAEKFRLFFDSLARAGLRLDFGREAVGEWSLPARDASLRIIQAGASEAAAAKKGRGGTVNRLHVTEAAFFERAETTFNSLLESVPGPEHGSEIVNESTPNGVGGFYYEQWQAAVIGSSGYKPHFFRWWDHPEYRLALEPGETIDPTNETEEKLVSLGVNPEQLKWYRRKVAEKGKSLTAQEYPSDPDSCFLVSGRSFFDQEVTTRLLALAQEPIERRERSRIRIYRKVEAGKLYILTLDPSEGGGGDPSGGSLRERATGDLAAVIDGQYQPWELARSGAALGREYNDALVAVERNNHGHATLQALEREEKYKKIYEHSDGKHGWPTNPVTRPEMLDALEDAHRHGHWRSPDRATLEQFRTFVIPPSGKPEAAPGSHDDLVLAEAIGWAVRQLPTRTYARAL